MSSHQLDTLQSASEHKTASLVQSINQIIEHCQRVSCIRCIHDGADRLTREWQSWRRTSSVLRTVKVRSSTCHSGWPKWTISFSLVLMPTSLVVTFQRNTRLSFAVLLRLFSIFRSTPKSRLNNMGLMSVCPSVRTSVHKKFFWFRWNLVCM